MTQSGHFFAVPPPPRQLFRSQRGRELAVVALQHDNRGTDLPRQGVDVSTRQQCQSCVGVVQAVQRRSAYQAIPQQACIGEQASEHRVEAVWLLPSAEAEHSIGQSLRDRLFTALTTTQDVTCSQSRQHGPDVVLGNQPARPRLAADLPPKVLHACSGEIQFPIQSLPQAPIPPDGAALASYDASTADAPPRRGSTDAQEAISHTARNRRRAVRPGAARLRFLYWPGYSSQRHPGPAGMRLRPAMG
jgi:hypothetical protein